MQEPPSKLDIAAAEVVAAISASEEPDSTAVSVLRAELLLRARGGGRSLADCEDAVAAVLEGFVRSALEGRIQAETAGAYAAQSLHNGLIDAHRRAATHAAAARGISVEVKAAAAGAADDEALARMLDADAARSDVLQGLEHAAADRRFTVVRVVAQWLDIAQRTGREPTSREVGDALGISHTAVNDALSEFREQHLPGRGPHA